LPFLKWQNTLFFVPICPDSSYFVRLLLTADSVTSQAVNPMKTTFALTPENAAVIEKWARLIGWTPTEFLNEVLRETLAQFEDEQSGHAEGFLGSHRYADRESVERAVAWIVDSYAKDQDPDRPEIRLWSKIREHQPDGYFDFTMTRFDQSGEQRIC